MVSRLLSLSDRQSILAAARAIADGGVVVAPTETRYGILVRADHEAAVGRLFEIKGRQSSNPTAMFVARPSDINRLGVVTPIAQGLIDAFLPGPLTLVLESRMSWAPPRVVDGKIGIRYSSSEFIQQIIDAVSALLTATSANLSGQPDRETISDIQADFGEQVDIYIDGGRLFGPVSTVVECVGPTCRILREGAIAPDQILRIAEQG